MTYQKQVTADISPAEPYTLNFQIPDPQKQALYQAIMTVITVVLGIAMTLIAQLVGQAMDVTQPPPTPIVQEFAVQELGDRIALLDNVPFTVTDPLTITGVLTNVVFIYRHNER